MTIRHFYPGGRTVETQRCLCVVIAKNLRVGTVKTVM